MGGCFYRLKTSVYEKSLSFVVPPAKQGTLHEWSGFCQSDRYLSIKG
jgi:hypothetical protein